MFLLMFSSGLFCFNLNKLSNIHTISILILFVSECRKKFHWMRKRSGWCWNTEERNRRGQTQRRSWRGFQEVSKILLKYTDRNQRAISHELAVDDERVWCSVKTPKRAIRSTEHGYREKISDRNKKSVS